MYSLLFARNDIIHLLNNVILLKKREFTSLESRSIMKIINFLNDNNNLCKQVSEKIDFKLLLITFSGKINYCVVWMAL